MKKIFTVIHFFHLDVEGFLMGTLKKCLIRLVNLKLPKETEIYCGHEYTLQNSDFCVKYDPENLKLKIRLKRLKKS